MTHRVLIPSWDEAGCQAALDRMTTMLEEGVFSLVEPDDDLETVLRFDFLYQDRIIDEPEFFDWVYSLNGAALENLRRFWQAFADQADREGWDCFEPWYDSQIEALGYCALAFSRIDQNAFNLLESWFLLRDVSHANFGEDRVLPTIADVNGWSSREAIRFGMTVIGNEWTFQGSWPLIPKLIESARQLFSPAEFRTSYEQALAAIDRYREPNPDNFRNMLDRVLDDQIVWDRQVRDLLEL